jgi:hypothetical protein
MLIKKDSKIESKNSLSMVRGGGLEPPHPCGRQDLNLVRLPISPPAHRKPKTSKLLLCSLIGYKPALKIG